VHININSPDWKLVGHYIWYIGPLDESTTPQLFRRLPASASRVIAQVIKVLFGILMIALFILWKSDLGIFCTVGRLSTL
jgi:hypothetical protein